MPNLFFWSTVWIVCFYHFVTWQGVQARSLEAAIEQIEDIPTNTLRGELAALHRKQVDGRLTASERERIPELEKEIDLRDAGTADLSGGSLSSSTTNVAR
jgi:hypothetical protein